MKRILTLIIATFCLLEAKAQEEVAKYSNSYFNKQYRVSASVKDGKIDFVSIGIEPSSAKIANLFMDGDKVDDFRRAIESVRDKYKEWCNIAKENNVTEMNKEFDITFPTVGFSWYSSKWYADFSQKLRLKFLIMKDGRMIVSHSPKLVSSANKYIDEQVYFVIGGEADFDSLIKALDTEAMLSHLLSKKKDEDLFQ